MKNKLYQNASVFFCIRIRKKLNYLIDQFKGARYLADYLLLQQYPKSMHPSAKSQSINLNKLAA